MDEALTRIVQQKFPHDVLGTHQFRGQATVLIEREALLSLAHFLKEEPTMGFDFLMDLTCVDYLKFGASLSSAPTLATPSPLPYYMKPKPVSETWERLPAAHLSAVPSTAQAGAAQAGGVSNDEYRFEVVYHFYSEAHNHRLRLKVPLTAADSTVASLTSLWESANWFEREVWDMFGITFTGHPNLTRILMYEGFQGHPLRKDYPVNRRQPLLGPIN